MTPDFAAIGPWAWLAIGYHLLSRLAYVVGVGVALAKQDRQQLFTRRDGVKAGFARFRRLAAILMNNDAVSFVVLCLITRRTVPAAFQSAAAQVTGVVLVVLGLSIKRWAAVRLGPGAYYWHNFFASEPLRPLDPPGPYRYLKNPMYTVGYLHAYGFALLLGSFPGLIAGVFDQVAVLVFHHWVEKPHLERLLRESSPE